MDNAGSSSSGSNIRSSLIGMGFAPALVDKVIDEKGGDHLHLLLETLLKYAEHDDANDSDTRAALLSMQFSEKEVDYAMNKQGMDAPINELVDFIVASQIAGKLSKGKAATPPEETQQKEVAKNEIPDEIMEKTMQLLEMGFSQKYISVAMEKFGPDVPVAEIADSICKVELAVEERKKKSSEPSSTTTSPPQKRSGLRIRSQLEQKPSPSNREGTSRRGKRAIQVCLDDDSASASKKIRKTDSERSQKKKGPKD